MNAKRDMGIAVALVVAAVATVLVARRGDEGSPGAVQEPGHAHGAAAVSAAQPVALDAEGARRIGLALATVEPRRLPLSVRAVGTVVYDETRLATVDPKIEGWVESLLVDFTGAPVRAGEPLLEVYSPMLVSAQQELILAASLAARAAEGRTRENAVELLESARRRLAYWDVPEDEIRAIEASREPRRTLTLRAPISGIVVEKNVVTGDRIMPGMTLYRIADLSVVWIEADVFEKDLALVTRGRGATVTFEAFPGRVFSGRVSFVYPTVSLRSRTARVRIELPNRDASLRPGMYASIDLDVPDAEPALVVPRSAAIVTGERSIVFVADESGVLRPRAVTLGRTSGQLTQVLSGLAAGERVASTAAFLVDAESSLGTMLPDEGNGTGDSAFASPAAATSAHQGHPN